MGKSPLQRISGEQARMERQWGYFKAEIRGQIESLIERVDILEELLRVSR